MSSSSESPASLKIHAHILLAEDNTSVRLLVGEYLRRAGANVTCVGNGAEALRHVTAALEKAGAAGEFDLVLMDVHMPEMDGPEAAQRIRAAGYAGPIVALTAHSLGENPAGWSGAGWDAIATKPIDRNTLIPQLVSLIQARRAAITGGSAGR